MAARPCLALRVPSDPAVVGELLAEGTAVPPPTRSAGTPPPVRGLRVVDLEPRLLDAVSRLLAQFGREYPRQFGSSPRRDVEAIKAEAQPAGWR